MSELSLLRRAALGPPAQATAAWREWLRRPPGSAADEGARPWLPLVWWNLREAGVDEGSLRALRQIHTAAWGGTLRLVAGALPAVRALEEAGISTLLLKGLALTYTVYPRPGLRTFGDVDVLVEPKAAQDAGALLARLGWHPIRPVAEPTQRLRHSLGLVNGGGVQVDLHWHALAECCADDADHGFWQRAGTLRLGPLTTKVLSPPDQLLHVAIHGLRWTAADSALWIADAVAILRHEGASFDWNRLVDEARRRRLTFQMGRALDVLRRAGLVDVPLAVTAALAAPPAGWLERLEYRAKAAPPSPARLLFLFWCVQARATPGWSAFTRTAAFARYLPAFAGHLRRGQR
jgi:hypothetical protein